MIRWAKIRSIKNCKAHAWGKYFGTKHGIFYVSLCGLMHADRELLNYVPKKSAAHELCKDCTKSSIFNPK